MSKPASITPEIHAQLRHVPASVGDALSLFPDFLLAGPPRTGSTWLFSHLASHPEIFLPRGKEIYFFSTLGNPEAKHFRFQSLADYLDDLSDSPLRRLRKLAKCLTTSGRLYRPKLRGEATATYATLDSEVIREITVLNPEIKVIIVLRDPFERAWSHAKKDLLDRHGRAPEDVKPEEFDKFFRAAGQMQNNRYSAILDNWRAHLEDGNLFAGEFRLVRDSPATLVEETLKFLGATGNDWLLNDPKLAKPVNATQKSTMPDSVESMIENRYADIRAEYQETLNSLSDNRVADGCYVL